MDIMSGVSKGLALVLMLIILFLTASCLIATKSVFADLVVPNSWAALAPMPTARSGLGVAVVDGSIYAIGGSTYQYTMRPDFPSALLPVVTNGWGGVVGTNEKYNYSKNSWTEMAQMPTPREYFATAVYNDVIYCIGGSDGNNSLATNEMYSPGNDSWTTKAPMPQPEQGVQANVVNGKINILGGDSNFVYDPVADIWTAMSPIPNKSGFMTSTVLDGKIFVFGTNMTEIYDLANQSWSSRAPYPELLNGNATSIATSGVNSAKQIYVFNEVFSSNWSESLHTESLIAATTLEAYNPTNNSWSSGAQLPSNRYSFAVAVLNDSFFVIGGCNAILYTAASWVPGSLTVVGINEQYLPIDYGTVPPEVSVSSPQSVSYSSTNVWLNFTINKPVNWKGYSLDGQSNVTINVNTMLTGLSYGKHNITVYANDTFGNVGASQTVAFTVVQPFLTVMVSVVSLAVAAVVIVAVVIISLLLFRRHRKTHQVKKT